MHEFWSQLSFLRALFSLTLIIFSKSFLVQLRSAAVYPCNLCISIGNKYQSSKQAKEIFFQFLFHFNNINLRTPKKRRKLLFWTNFCDSANYPYSASHFLLNRNWIHLLRVTIFEKIERTFRFYIFLYEYLIFLINLLISDLRYIWR